MNTLNIIKGRVDGAKRVIIYGPEGIGKSTLASKFPAPLFLDTEDGSGELDVDRVPCLDWRAIESAVRNFPAGYKTCVIDTADWAERALTEHFLKTKGLKSIEDVSFGKGFTQVAELWARFLADLDGLIARGINVVLVAHSKVTKVSPPDQTDGYDRYELKLSKPSVGPTKEWAQMVLFGNFKLNLVEGTDGRIKAQGGKERVMYATHSAAWDAKNRFDLPDDLKAPCWRTHTKGSGDVMGRLWWDRPSVTIRTEFWKPEKGRYLHPEQDRAITHYEAALLQGFSPLRKWVGTKTSIGRQIGNAVPVPLARAIARHLADQDE